MDDNEALLLLKRVAERDTVREIAKEWGLSSTAIFDRLVFLEGLGLIYTTEPNVSRNKKLTDLGKEALDKNFIPYQSDPSEKEKDDDKND